MLSHGIQLRPIRERQGYFRLSLIGWSVSRELKGHIPGTQPAAQTGSQSRFACTFPFASSLKQHICLSSILCGLIFMFQFFFFYPISLLFPRLQLVQITKKPISLASLLCNCICNSQGKLFMSRGHPFLCGEHPGPSSPWTPYFQTLSLSLFGTNLKACKRQSPYGHNLSL